MLAVILQYYYDSVMVGFVSFHTSTLYADAAFLKILMPTGAGRVMLDMFNEPDIFALQWERRIIYQGILYPSLPELLLPAMQVRPASAYTLRTRVVFCNPGLSELPNMRARHRYAAHAGVGLISFGGAGGTLLAVVARIT